MNKYNSWPLGKLPKEFQRLEPEQLRQLGYEWDDPRDIIGIFEHKVKEFAGSKYAVAVDCCSHAIFLSLKYFQFRWFMGTDFQEITIPTHTYISVPQTIIHAGLTVKYKDLEWSGAYNLYPTNVWDAAVRWTKGMYIPDSLMCLSFQIKKRVPIGRGGMILTNDKEAYDWLKLASYDGRDLDTPYNSKGHVKMIGWHYYMTPEDAARGIILMDQVPEINEDQGSYLNYTNIEHIY